MIALFVVLALQADPAGCAKDSDCLIITSSGCCGDCCSPPPFARSQKEDKLLMQRCAIMDCMAPNCSKVVCKPTEPARNFTAVCRAGACVAVSVESRKNRCESDAECTVDYPSMPADVCSDSVCGCCPGTEPLAVLVRDVQIPRDRTPAPPRPLAKKEAPPPLGVNPAPPNPPQPQQLPNCSPCPGRRPARAICAEHHCVLDRPHAL